MSRSVVVTGGATGIGKGVAAHFAGLGDQVVILGRRKELLEAAAAELGPNVRAISCDVTDPVELGSAVAQLPDVVDVLVNTVGSNMATHAPAPADLSDVRNLWLSQMEANVVVAVLATTAILPRMPEGGRIVNFSSNAARTGGAYSFGYGAAKAAIESWTRALAHEVGARGITANAVAPGITDGTDFFPTPLADDRRAALLARAANARSASVADVVATVAFLASREAAHVTAHTMPVDGGVVFAK